MYSVEKGKTLIVTTMVLVLFFEIIFSIMSFFFAKGDIKSDLIEHIVGLVFIILCFILLLAGQGWIKWILAIILEFFGSIYLITLFTCGNIIKAVIGIVYIIFGLVILFSKDIKNYLDFKKGKYIIEEDQKLN